MRYYLIQIVFNYTDIERNPGVFAIKTRYKKSFTFEVHGNWRPNE